MAYYPGQFVSIDVSISQGYGNTCYDCECEGHIDVPAITVLVGSVDSYGSEFYPMCKKHKDSYIVHRDQKMEEELKNPTGCCDWCNTSNVVVSPRRDFEEGSSGRLYDVCSKCIDKENKAIQRELG